MTFLCGNFLILGDYTLRIHPVKLQDDAQYQCQVSASDGVPGIQTKPVKLTVYVPPDPPEVKPKELETTAGVTVELECVSKGGRPASEVSRANVIMQALLRENLEASELLYFSRE